MIIAENTSSPVVSNVLATPSKFKIKASAKAFKILSGFYSEPILAIPRELGANAWDSHVKAGNTKQMFEVHAPNTLEPWFAIRDFGTGLSPEAIDTIYTTYFESTKTADNDSDGCMGLGSKTPFNYTDNFNVTSFYNGKKYVYNCFIDETGSPNIMQIATVDTTEQNGIEVKFGVKIADIGMWVEKITRAYEPFRYRPVIKGATVEYKSREYIYEGKKWAMRKNEDHTYYNRGCNAFMGNYCYPINATAFRNIIYTEKLDSAFNYGNFDLFFNIGDLEVAPNKEQLQYDDNNTTTTAIIAALKNTVIELKNMVEKNVETPKSLWESMYLYNKYNGYNSKYGHIRNVIGEIPIKYNGESIRVGNYNVNGVHKTADCLSENGTLEYFRLYVLESLNGKIKSTNVYHPHSDTKSVRIFYTNSTIIKKSRLRHYLNTTYTVDNMPTCFIVSDASTNNSTFFKHAKYFGWDSSMIVNIDTLPKAPMAPRQKKTAGTDEIYYADISDFFSSKKGNYVGWSKKASTFDSNGTYYYVDFYYAESVYGPDNKNINSILDEAVQLLAQDKVISDTTIYGINMKNKSLLSVGTWINIMDLAQKTILANKSKYEQDMYRMSQIPNFGKLNHLYSKLSACPSIIANLKNEDTRNMLKTFIKTYAAVHATPVVSHELLTMFKVKAVKHEDIGIDPIQLTKTLETKYFNLFNCIDIYNNNAKVVYNLINFIDEKS